MSSPSGPFTPPPNGGPFVPPAQQSSYGQPQQYPTQPTHPAQPQYAQPQYPGQPQHPGQRPTAWRTLTIDMKQPGWYAWTWLQPTVTIDGYAYSAGWTRLTYQIPADRPVYVQCHINYLWAYGKTGVMLEPQHNPHLEYQAPASAWFAGELGAPGTTKVNGKGVTIALLSVMGALILLCLASIVGLVVLGSLR